MKIPSGPTDEPTGTHHTPVRNTSARTRDYDVTIIGAGLVGLATARALRRADPGLRVIVLEKESAIAAHQSGHNSGVLHSGIYYRAGSQRSRLCVDGKQELEAWCRSNDVAFETCGKVIVATTTDELGGLEALFERGLSNGVELEMVDRVRLAELEPHVDGLAAIHIPATGVIDFADVARSLGAELADHGVPVVLGTPVIGIRESDDGVTIDTTDGTVRSDRLVNCAGLHSDRIARLAGHATAVRIVPFRGEYHELVAQRRHLVRNLVYPVPDPRFPFLGVHFTRRLDGRVHIGPNAVLALSREGYRRHQIRMSDLGTMVTDPAVWRLARRYAPTGAVEVLHALSRRSFIRALQRLVPDVRSEDVVRAGSGVRAQAVRDDGSLEDDFVFSLSPRSLHVLNAPSPAATASFAIGRRVAETLLAKH